MKLTNYTPPAGYDRSRIAYPIHAIKSEARELAITQLVNDSIARGETNNDRFYFTLVFDLEMAAMTTNQAQLLEIGIDPRTATLWEMINGLADLGIYLLHTNHLSDEQLFNKLCADIITEKVRDLPPSRGVNEFVDLKGGAESTNDETDNLCNRNDYLPTPTNKEPEPAEEEIHFGFKVCNESEEGPESVGTGKKKKQSRKVKVGLN